MWRACEECVESSRARRRLYGCREFQRTDASELAESNSKADRGGSDGPPRGVFGARGGSARVAGRGGRAACGACGRAVPERPWQQLLLRQVSARVGRWRRVGVGGWSAGGTGQWKRPRPLEGDSAVARKEEELVGVRSTSTSYRGMDGATSEKGGKRRRMGMFRGGSGQDLPLGGWVRESGLSRASVGGDRSCREVRSFAGDGPRVKGRA